jgi:hypothetical protein
VRVLVTRSDHFAVIRPESALRTLRETDSVNRPACNFAQNLVTSTKLFSLYIVTHPKLQLRHIRALKAGIL